MGDAALGTQRRVLTSWLCYTRILDILSLTGSEQEEDQVLHYRTSNDLDAIRDELSYNGPGSCWRTTMAAFGVETDGSELTFFSSTVAHLEAAGYTVERLKVSIELPALRYSAGGRPSLYTYQSLGRFIEDHPQGDYVIQVAGHVMALRDGKLTDTDLASGGLRRVLLAARVTRP